MKKYLGIMSLVNLDDMGIFSDVVETALQIPKVARFRKLFLWHAE